MSLKPILLAGVFSFLPALAAGAAETASPAPANLFAPAPAVAATANPAALPAKAATPFILERPKTAAGDAGPAPAPAAADTVDVSALRYYAAQNDLSRVSAEIRLLRSKHPNWEPPADLFSDIHTGGADEQPLWDLFAKHDLAGVRTAIDAMRQTKPDWQPSSELAQKLALAEAHDTLVAASNGQRWADVVDVASNNRALLTCQDLDALWRTAEALVHLNDEPRAFEAYRYALANCPKPQERLATVQKAGLLLQTPGSLEQLIAMGRRGSDGRNEFESIKADQVRRVIGDAAGGKSSVEPTAQDLATLEASYNATHAAADAQLLGWYAYARKDFPKAETWFRSASSGAVDPKAMEGLVLALREQHKLGEAEDVALRNRALADPNRKVFVELTAALLVDPAKPVPLAPETIAAFKQDIETTRSGDGAQAYGWSLFNANDVAGANEWFRKAMDWAPSEGAAVGQLVCARRLHLTRDYAELVAKYRGTYTRVAELESVMGQAKAERKRTAAHAGGRRGRSQVARAGGGESGWDSGADAIVTTFKAGQYDQALTMLDARKSTKGEPRGLGVIRGWAQYHRGDWASAQQTFTALHDKDPSNDTETGLRIIKQGYLPPVMR